MPQLGDTVGRYVIEAVLGEGGMGRVYRALDPSLGRRVALKVLLGGSRTGRESADAATRMLREARAAAAFTHPNVVAIHDVGEVEGTPFIAMELVVGSTLRALMTAGEVPEAKKLRWLIDVARGLGAAHRAGLVHRDVKPENIMITTDGDVKVLDFGIARRAEADAVDGSTPTEAAHIVSVTEEGHALGTPQYMAPEQINATALDGRCDQYAWGVTAYEVFAGKLPWGGKQGSPLIAAIVCALAVPLDDVAPSVDRRIRMVVARAMQKDRQARFASMTELVDALTTPELAPQLGPAAAPVLPPNDGASAMGSQSVTEVGHQLRANAEALVKAERYDEAIVELLRIVREDPNDARTLLKVGDLYSKIPDFPNAIATYERVGTFYAHEGFALKAIAVYKQIREMLTKHAPQLEERYAHITPLLADLFQQIGLIDDAIEALDEIATRLLRERKDAEALGVLRRIAELDPTNPLPHLRIAETLSRLQGAAGAVE